ncbi:DUF4359 domain-containing protein [Anaeromicrobium sediminis]|uniref:Uncharacterized protein n=1 Tax=Anaeromicrobium sediminis TaxID=1478221 RepID=A0A267MNN0_9FIRM|nr:DUF4359 domain-containing protein [Anaeromicrobium sediminis]PAB61146.1 hypothetical protein CCE28_01600 [Anaeromicrobium sediminis]
MLGEKIINESTQSDNYMVFSVYTTDLGYEKIKVLGALNNFITIGRTEKVKARDN